MNAQRVSNARPEELPGNGLANASATACDDYAQLCVGGSPESAHACPVQGSIQAAHSRTHGCWHPAWGRFKSCKQRTTLLVRDPEKFNDILAESHSVIMAQHLKCRERDEWEQPHVHYKPDLAVKRDTLLVVNCQVVPDSWHTAPSRYAEARMSPMGLCRPRSACSPVCLMKGKALLGTKLGPRSDSRLDWA